MKKLVVFQHFSQSLKISQAKNLSKSLKISQTENRIPKAFPLKSILWASKSRIWRDFERFWEILRDSERFWQILRDFGRCWEILKDVERSWEISTDTCMRMQGFWIKQSSHWESVPHISEIRPTHRWIVGPGPIASTYPSLCRTNLGGMGDRFSMGQCHGLSLLHFNCRLNCGKGLYGAGGRMSGWSPTLSGRMGWPPPSPAATSGIAAAAMRRSGPPLWWGLGHGGSIEVGYACEMWLHAAETCFQRPPKHHQTSLEKTIQALCNNQ